jgi:SAM-dependent methyltransferase
MSDPFAPFAEIYDLWLSSAPVTAQHVPFYVEEFSRADGPVAEIGVGNGRITIEAARRGIEITGVDVSPAMLSLCRERAAAAGVAERVRLIESNMLTFALPAPASLIAIPFSTVGHAVSLDEKAALFRNVHANLAAGGRFVFDSFVFDPELAKVQTNVPRLRAESHDETTGDDIVLWVCPVHDVPRQRMRIVAWTDRVGTDGSVKSRRYCRMDFGWIAPEQARSLLESAGFDVESCFGSFDRTPFTARSSLQIWSARRR